MSASVFSGNAQTISREQAQALASEFFAQGTRATRAVTPAIAYQWDSRHLSPVATVAAEETAPAFYTFAPESGEGFVIISSDANNPRVLGYSLDSSLPSVDNIPDGMRDFLTEYSVAPAQTKQSRASYNATTMGNIIVNLNTAPWGQSAPFNKLCFTSTGQQAKTGCVPTAYSILMHYHQWPNAAIEKVVQHTGTGEKITLGHEYDWAKMLHSYSGTYNEEQADAMATLMRDVGYAYGVVYGVYETQSGGGGEGAGTLIDVFKYKSDTPSNSSGNHTRATVRDVLRNDVLWKQYIKQSLDAGLPIPYSSIVKNPTTGESRGRHIFILDGYTDNDYYHFNWGWGGSANGWFTLDAMVTDAQSDYSIDHKAYFMLSPDKGEPCTITVYADCGTCGTVSVAYGNSNGTSISVDQGANVTLTATPYSGYIFEKWTCGTEDVSTSATCKVSAEGDAEYVAHFKEIATIFYTVDVSSAEATFGLVKIDGDAATASANKTVNHGTTVTLTAEAKDGYLFKNWTRDDEVVSIDNPWEVTVEENVSYKANFVFKQQDANITITTTTEGSGSVTINGESAGSLAAKVNEEITLAATPASGYYFVEWRVGDEVVSTKATFTTSAQADRTYKAVFAELPTGDVKIYFGSKNGNAFLSKDGVNQSTGTSFAPGTRLRLKAQKTKYDFICWSVGGSLANGGKAFSNEMELEVVVTKQTTYFANFGTATPVSATASANTGGTAEVTGDQTYAGEVIFKATANTGYNFTNWKNAGGDVVSTEPYYTTLLTSALALTANFEVSGSVGPSTPEVYNISVSVNGTNGTATASSNSVTQGQQVTLTATPNAGYKFVNWTLGGTVVSTEATYTFTPTASGEYVANFAPITYTVQASTANRDLGMIQIGEEAGTGTTIQTATVNHGSTVTMHAIVTNPTLYRFVNWTSGTNVVSTDNPWRFTASADVNYVANFEAIPVVTPQYTISVSAANGQGVVTATSGTNSGTSLTVDQGTQVTLTATPNEGYQFVNWTRGGVEVSTNAEYTVIVNATEEYVANFEQDVVVEPEVPSTSPEDGKAYIIRNVQKDGTMYMLTNNYYWDNNDKTVAKLPSATGTKEDVASDYSNVFICRVIDKENKKYYAFVNAKNGLYMMYHGIGQTDPFPSDESNIPGFMAYDNGDNKKCDLVVTESDTKSGHYTISGLRNRLDKGNDAWATMTIGHDGVMNANGTINKPSYDDSYSSLFTFTEVLDYPNKVTLASFEGSQLITNLEGYTIGTFSAPFPTLISDGNVVAYYAEQVKGTEYVKLRAIATTAAIPAKQGVILVGTTAETTKALMVPATSEQQADLSSNLFKNSAGKKASMQEGDFVLARGSQGIGFYPVNIDNSNGTEGTTLAMNKAFLRMGTSNVAAFRLVVDEEVTAIDGVTTEKADTPIYDLSGRRVMQTVKGGVYIQNGKKFIVK